MSNEGEKTCPLCAEEMDLTDQQLKPCNCGYQICVWCWHHIMNMAEKDETAGRCPACRAPYNKEKIVGMGAKCERLVSEMSSEKKFKSQKGKSKTLEGRKQLSSVRVVQRNLVYVVGLPVNLADEDLLQRKEYFGQYGKVLKVSISRTAAGAIQQFTNSTCSVYITYSKEEEAVRCIQSVHGFILEGRSLRACFGTTKYCHAWLRNVPCSNPDCLYLHEIGLQEDSFTKDEIISAYTSRVQQITGATNSVQRHSGNVLPPPADDYSNSSYVSSGKPSSKTTTQTNNPVNSIKVSPPNSSSGRSAALPAGASWGTRASNNQPLSTSMPCSNGLHKQKPNDCNGPESFSTAVASSSQVSSLHIDPGKKLIPSEESNTSRDKSKLETVEPVKKDSSTDDRTILNSSSSSVLTVTSSINWQRGQPTSKDKGGDASMPPGTNDSDSVNQSLKSCGPHSDKDSNDSTDGKIENICSQIFSMSIDGNQQLQNGYAEHIGGPLISEISGKFALPIDEDYASNSQSQMKLETQMQVSQVDSLEMEDNLLSFDKQRLKDPEFASNRNSIPDFSHSFHLSKHSNFYSPMHNNADPSVRVNVDRQIVYTKDNMIDSNPVMSNEHPENDFSSSSELVNDVEYTYLFPSNKDKSSPLGRFEGEAAYHSHPAAADNMGESSIISDILSMDSYSWDDSLTSPQNLAKLFGETDERQASSGVPSSRKIQYSNQSRFSFAREEPMNRASDFGLTTKYVEQAIKDRSSGNDFTNSNSFHLEKFGSGNRLSLFNGVESDNFGSSHSYLSSNKLPVSRSQVSAPPGFSVPSRAPPPGFISHERTVQIFDPPSGNYMPDASLLSRNQYPAPRSGDSLSNGEIEFMDPAILAVGKGMLPGSLNSSSLDARLSYSPQYGSLEELRFRSSIPTSVPPHQNQRFTDSGHSYSPLGDVYGVPSRVLEQTLANNLSTFSQFTIPQPRNATTSNGQWDGWNTVQGENNLGMAELLRNERMGFPNYYNGYEDSKIRLPNSGNLYNWADGI